MSEVQGQVVHYRARRAFKVPFKSNPGLVEPIKKIFLDKKEASKFCNRIGMNAVDGYVWRGDWNDTAHLSNSYGGILMLLFADKNEPKEDVTIAEICIDDLR